MYCATLINIIIFQFLFSFGSLDIPLIRRTTINELSGTPRVPLIPSGTRPLTLPTSSFKQVG